MSPLNAEAKFSPERDDADLLTWSDWDPPCFGEEEKFGASSSAEGDCVKSTTPVTDVPIVWARCFSDASIRGVRGDEEVAR